MNNKDLLLLNSPELVHSYINSLLKFLEENDIELFVSEESRIEILNVKCSGCFSAQGKKLSIAIGRPFSEWLPVLLHEHCHARQYVEKKDWFSNLDKSCDIVFSWQVGEEFSKEVLDEAFADVILVESDCEKRTCELITEFNFQDIINVSDYARQANTYVQYYQQFYETRIWPEIQPYTRKEVWERFPNKIHVGVMKLTKRQWEAFSWNLKKEEINE